MWDESAEDSETTEQKPPRMTDPLDKEEERRRIKESIYPSNVRRQKQNQHIEGTEEFQRRKEYLQKINPGSAQSILLVDAQELVDKYKGTGTIIYVDGHYPGERIVTDEVIGQTWYKDKQKYVDTKAFRIIYSSKGVHIYPVNMWREDHKDE
jgi:hypothetical protein